MRCLICSACLFWSTAQAEYRIFTSTDGSQIEAKIIECESEATVTIERQDGVQFKNVPVQRFSKEDRKFISEWFKADILKYEDAYLTSEADLSITFVRGRDNDHNSYGDIDDRIIDINPEVVIGNNDKDYSFKHLNVTSIVIGEGVAASRGIFVLLDKQQFSMEVAADSKAEWKGEGFTVAYDPDFSGFDYGGFLVIIRNRDGHITHMKASKVLLEKNYQNIEKAEKMTGYNKTFSETQRLYSTFGLDE